ncbi:NUDIX hydrolase [Sulfitobacter sp. PS-8MA]|uniref:NUDIX hydrolase n=1 Tax=Sulfitobacter sp. PS-8MA TaxID=3237707 RepID=UPI0034C638FA
MTTQTPITRNPADKAGQRLQLAALCWRRKAGRLQVLLVTSRGRKRWIVPKGWPMAGKPPQESALVEAWEEAGVQGKAGAEPLGSYSYTKAGPKGPIACLALLYPVKVKALAKHYPEAGQRQRRWCSPKKAAGLLDNADLARLILHFDPKSAAR